MSYIVMAIQEEGSEIRLNDYDEHSRGFDTKASAASAADKLCEEYVEYRQIWIEKLKDAAYYAKNMALDEYGNDLDGYNDGQEW